jgi:hypothetical protein
VAGGACHLPTTWSPGREGIAPNHALSCHALALPPWHLPCHAPTVRSLRFFLGFLAAPSPSAGLALPSFLAPTFLASFFLSPAFLAPCAWPSRACWSKVPELCWLPPRQHSSCEAMRLTHRQSWRVACVSKFLWHLNPKHFGDAGNVGPCGTCTLLSPLAPFLPFFFLPSLAAFSMSCKLKFAKCQRSQRTRAGLCIQISTIRAKLAHQ